VTYKDGEIDPNELANNVFILQQLLLDWQKADMKNKKAAQRAAFLISKNDS